MTWKRSKTILPSASGTQRRTQGRYQALEPRGYSTCGVTNAGVVECWGQAFGGFAVTMDTCPVGTDAFTSCWFTPRNLAPGWTFQAGPGWGRGNTFCGLNAGVLYCWGYNNRGSVGVGTTTNQPVPVKVYGQP